MEICDGEKRYREKYMKYDLFIIKGIIRIEKNSNNFLDLIRDKEEHVILKREEKN